VDLQQPKFFQSDFQLEFKDISLGLNGLVSASGITRIFLPEMMQDVLEGVVGEHVRVRLDGKETEAVLSQQLVADGAFYELRFRSAPEALARYIEGRAKIDGASPGWERKFPRIPVVEGKDDGLPRPNLCMLRFGGQEHIANIRDFTLGGLRVEAPAAQLSSLRAGSLLELDLVTTAGDLILNISCEVRYIAIQERPGEGELAPMRAVGLRFIEMETAADRKYKSLIQEYCVALRKRLAKEK